jgi:hypothetical protein
MQRIDCRTTLSLPTSSFLGVLSIHVRWRLALPAHHASLAVHGLAFGFRLCNFGRLRYVTQECIVHGSGRGYELWRSRFSVVYAWRPGIVSFLVTQRLRRYHWMRVGVVAAFIGWRFNTIF